MLAVRKHHRFTRRAIPTATSQAAVGDNPGEAGTNSYNGVTFFYMIGDDVAADTEVTLSVYDSECRRCRRHLDLEPETGAE